MKQSQLMIVLLWTVLVLSPALAQTNAVDTRKLYDESYKTFRDGDYAEAIKGFDKCIKANPAFVKPLSFGARATSCSTSTRRQSVTWTKLFSWIRRIPRHSTTVAALTFSKATPSRRSKTMIAS